MKHIPKPTMGQVYFYPMGEFSRETLSIYMQQSINLSKKNLSKVANWNTNQSLPRIKCISTHFLGQLYPFICIEHKLVKKPFTLWKVEWNGVLCPLTFNIKQHQLGKFWQVAQMILVNGKTSSKSLWLQNTNLQSIIDQDQSHVCVNLWYGSESIMFVLIRTRSQSETFWSESICLSLIRLNKVHLIRINQKY